jgi:hypothetical protein
LVVNGIERAVLSDKVGSGSVGLTRIGAGSSFRSVVTITELLPGTAVALAHSAAGTAPSVTSGTTDGRGSAIGPVGGSGPAGPVGANGATSVVGAIGAIAALWDGAVSGPIIAAASAAAAAALAAAALTTAASFTRVSTAVPRSNCALP